MLIYHLPLPEPGETWRTLPGSAPTFAIKQSLQGRQLFIAEGEGGLFREMTLTPENLFWARLSGGGEAFLSCFTNGLLELRVSLSQEKEARNEVLLMSRRLLLLL